MQTWISDIRQLYLQSNRTEIVEMREQNLAIEAEGGTVPEPEIREPGFRALVEENVKLGVKRLSESSVISNVSLLSLVLPAYGIETDNEWLVARPSRCRRQYDRRDQGETCRRSCST